MKLTILLIFIGFLQVNATVFGQHINLKENNISLPKLFKELEKQSGYTFFYKEDVIKYLPNVNIEVNDATIQEVLDKYFKNKLLDYLIIDKSIVIKSITYPTIQINVRSPRLFVGKVVDEDKQPLAGVIIKIKNASTGQTVTNARGEFTILVLDENAILQFSFIGYVTQEVPIKGVKNPLNITMKMSSSPLDQVQILAYSTVQKRYNTGSSATITAEDIAKNPVPNVLQAMQNMVPGLSITQNTGQPGGSFVVQVRGINGFSNVDPLYIIDGVEYPAGGTNGDPSGQNRPGQLPIIGGINNTPGVQRGGNALNYINPEDIESVNILKDADATSVYGSRGAYGVILITTKKAKAGKPNLRVNLNSGLTMVGTSPQLLNTADYLMIRREGFKNDGTTPTATDVDVNGTYPETRYTNWQKELVGHTAATSRLNATYSGGSNGTNYLIGANYNTQDNVESAKGTFQNGGARFNLNSTTANNKFTLDFTSSFNSTVNTMVPIDFANSGATVMAPNAPALYNPDGSLNWETGNNLANGIVTVYKGVTNNLLASTALTYKPVKGLTAKAVIGYSLLTGTELRYIPTTYYSPTTTNAAQVTTSTSSYYNIRSITFDPNINYTTKGGSKGTLSITAGGTMEDKLINSTGITGTGFTTDALLNNPSLGTTVTTGYTQLLNRYLGVFGILSYNWDSKYFVDFNVRNDGSTKFGADHRFGTFGSAAAAYVFSDEKWIKENFKFLSFGKLRASIGTSGGDGINNYLYLPRYVSITTPYLGKTGLTNSSLSNPDLHWELNKKRDIGIVLGFFNDRITVDAGYYKNTTTDQLVPQPLSTVTGYSLITLNSPALIENTGTELTLTTSNVVSKNFNWTSVAVFTIPRNKLDSYPAGLTFTNASAVVGLPLTNIKLYNYVGVNPQTGNYNFTNAAGVQGEYASFTSSLNQITDKTTNLTLGIKYSGSLSNTVSYKSLSLSFTFSLVNEVGLNYLGQQTNLPGILNQNETTAILARWQKPGDITNIPRATTNGLLSLFSQNNFRQSTGAYEKIIYSRLQNLSLSYAVPKNIIQKIGVQAANVVLQGQNLLTISKYGDLDPENMTAGALPPLRIFNLGVNLTF